MGQKGGAGCRSQKASKDCVTFRQGASPRPPSPDSPGWPQGRLPFPGKSSHPTPTAPGNLSDPGQASSPMCFLTHHGESRKLITEEPVPLSQEAAPETWNVPRVLQSPSAGRPSLFSGARMGIFLRTFPTWSLKWAPDPAFLQTRRQCTRRPGWSGFFWHPSKPQTEGEEKLLVSPRKEPPPSHPPS